MLSKQLSGSCVTTKGLIRSHCHSLRDIRPPWGLSGSSLKLSSDPIIQLAKALVRPESDDNWNTSKGSPGSPKAGATTIPEIPVTREKKTLFAEVFKRIYNKQVQTSLRKRLCQHKTVSKGGSNYHWI